MHIPFAHFGLFCANMHQNLSAQKLYEYKVVIFWNLAIGKNSIRRNFHTSVNCRFSRLTFSAFFQCFCLLQRKIFDVKHKMRLYPRFQTGFQSEEVENSWTTLYLQVRRLFEFYCTIFNTSVYAFCLELKPIYLICNYFLYCSGEPVLCVLHMKKLLLKVFLPAILCRYFLFL